ncbi:slit -like protein [Brachionus plicatilis]|uniref:Slit-like protein n=1 Tax=Brachionus plicatilis TaxID=10195 RepID=A0A3M7QRJ9_BRAPC|nr:slit -like protein [Brachionus plicatilis]
MINCRLNINFESHILEVRLKESTKFQEYDQLIKSKNDQVIIDLSEREKNQIDGLKLSKSGFELIPTYLDVESVKELKIVGYKDIKFPTQLFRPFKNLTRLEIKDSLNENSFIGLENLEILELSENKIDIEENTFKALINLKQLIFTSCYFGNFHKTNGRENLKQLKLKDCTFADFRLEYLELFKNLENLQIFTSRFAKSEIKSFNRFEKLKILETDLEEEMHLKSNLEILSLEFQSFKPHASFNGLKFLNIRVECPLNQIEHLNQLNQLEFLDFKLPNKLTKKFNQVNLPKLKFLVLTCRNTPNFNQSLQNLQGLELIGASFMPRDQLKNLKSLDYLAFIDPSELYSFHGTTFSTIKNLKFLKIENDYNQFPFDDDKRNRINEEMSKLFESPENVLFYDDMCVI